MLTQMPDAASSEASTALAVYGTLAPGQENHGQIATIAGRWMLGTLRGRLVPEGWGAAPGDPGLVLDLEGPVVEAHAHESDDPPAHRARLDGFERPGYLRLPVTVDLAPAPRIAPIYGLAEQA
jgi:gamma-glutamylcyclotransferase (GGCT)/AIG2-like uncharacterized protein YtfP